MIEIENLVFDYPAKRALHGVSATIAAESVTALVGPNGAGKTTLLRCVAGLDQPLAGAITLDGIDVLRHPREAHRHLGYLRDLFGLYDDLTVRRGLLFHAAAFGVPALEQAAAVAKAARRLQLDDRMDQKAGTLSRGLRQRLAIAQVIVHEPRVLLLDEPASGLDPEARRLLAELILELQAQGATIVVSSHILSELEDYSSDLLIVADGRILDHRPLHGRAAADDRKRSRQLALRLTTADEGLRERLEAESAISDLDIDGAAARFAFAGDDAAQAALLGRLVAAGLPVASFGADRQRMEEVYLGALRSAGAGNAEMMRRAG